jgi:hypothetical protein
MAILDTSSVRGFLDSAKQISILLPQKPDFDYLAAGLGLKLSLASGGKIVRVVCADQMLVEFNRLVGIESVNSDFGSRNLVICFPGQTEHVDQVNYNLEKGELQLIITPKPEAPDLDHTRLKYITATQKQDLIITLGVTDLKDLGPVYDQAKEHIGQTTVISISHLPHRRPFTNYLLHDHEASSLSEITTHIIDSLSLPLDPDTATNLLLGLEKATANFKSSKVSVSTFEAAAKLMRRGAKRHADEISAADFPVGAIPKAADTQQISVGSEMGLEPLELAPDELPVEQTSITSAAAAPSAKTNGKKSAPPDWYEPKIYKGPMLP